MKLSVKVDAADDAGARRRTKARRNIIMFSSGEQTPFEIEITPQWKSIPWRVKSDGLRRRDAARNAQRAATRARLHADRTADRGRDLRGCRD